MSKPQMQVTVRSLVGVCGIYRIINRVNGKSYVGASTNIWRRWKEHRVRRNSGGAPSLSLAVGKYGREVFSIELVESCTALDLMNREVFWIARLSPEYNRSPGGFGNAAPRSDEVRAKLSAACRAAWDRKSPEQKQAVITDNLTGPRFEHPVSTATRQKLSAALTGIRLSSATRAKIGGANRVAMLGNRNGSRPVVQISQTGVELAYFPSAVAAAAQCGIHPSGITSVIRGRRKIAAGFLWKDFSTSFFN